MTTPVYWLTLTRPFVGTVHVSDPPETVRLSSTPLESAITPMATSTSPVCTANDAVVFGGVVLFQAVSASWMNVGAGIRCAPALGRCGSPAPRSTAQYLACAIRSR